MKAILNIAQYIYDEYRKIKETEIDEMKLHKLLYFSQRESFVESDKPLFKEDFQGWKFGPVCIEVREAYKKEYFKKNKYFTNISNYEKKICDKIIETYGSKDSWSLSRITHAEISWNEARKNLKDGENGNEIMLIENIKKDALKLKKRREFLKNKLSKSTNNNPTDSKYIISLSEEQIQEINDSEIKIDIKKNIEIIKKNLRKQGVDI